jgi:hypothetical protein
MVFQTRAILQPVVSQPMIPFQFSSVWEVCGIECRQGLTRFSVRPAGSFRKGDGGRVFLARALLQNAEVPN